MHTRIAAVAVAALISLVPCVSAKTYGELCQNTDTVADGNSYCAQVTRITYQNVSQAGSYNRTTDMNVLNGVCSFANVTFTGSDVSTPFFGEISMHLRGPMNISQIAVYTLPPTVGHTKRGIFDSLIRGLKHVHNVPRQLTESRQPLASFFDMRPSPSSSSSLTTSSLTNDASQASLQSISSIVDTATFATSLSTGMMSSQTTSALMNTVDNSFISMFGSLNAAATSTSEDVDTITCTTIVVITVTVFTTVSDTCQVTGDDESSTSFRFIHSATDAELSLTSASSDDIFSISSSVISSASATTTSQIQSIASKQSSVNADQVTWTRVASYSSAASAQATGLAFLNNKGNDGVSGTFDTTFGNSLSYASSDGTTCAAVSTPFDGNLSTTEIELAVFTGEECDGNCGYYRPNTTAYHGWGGNSKAFLIEFQMDHRNNSNHIQGALQDAPAWWFLNAEIPRVLQYGEANGLPCSCWSTGCGEFDAFEVLAAGEERAKSTIHRPGNIEGGDSNWFLRPVGKTIKVAVVFYEGNITVTILDDNLEFGETLSASQIAEMTSYNPTSDTDSLFVIGS